jgi:hypothetical protein
MTMAKANTRTYTAVSMLKSEAFLGQVNTNQSTNSNHDVIQNSDGLSLEYSSVQDREQYEDRGEKYLGQMHKARLV